jgi:hypothetical protein
MRYLKLNSYVFAGIFCLLFFYSCDRSIETPAIKNNFSSPSTSFEVVKFSKAVSEKYDFLSYHVFGNTATGKDLIALKASKNSESDSALKVLIFAQQHGDEQSGKEALLMLIQDIAKYQNRLDKIELWIVPQVNPEGSDINERRTSLEIDLNRDHLVLQAPESKALRSLFYEIMPHVTVDIHEYYPYGESWKNFGGYKNFDVQVGIPTNINVSEEIRLYALTEILPSIESHINSKGFSFYNYIVGPAPNKGRIRHSTVDINDGRQSFGILNTLSLIYEGINGKDGYVDNLKSRTYGQYEAVIALIDFLYENSDNVIDMVDSNRNRLISPQQNEKVVIRMDHFYGDAPLLLPLVSSKTNNDTVVVAENYHPIVKPLLEVEKPKAYLVNANDSLLIELLSNHRIEYFDNYDLGKDKITGYHISKIDTVIIEELKSRMPDIKKIQIKKLDEKYFYVPTAQLQSNLLVLIFEPQSMLGLAQREGFEYLLAEGELFPVFRVE